MRLLNIAVIMIVAAFASPVSATENKQHTDLGKLLAQSSFKYVDLSKHKSDISHSLFAKRDSHGKREYIHDLMGNGRDDSEDRTDVWSRIDEHENEDRHESRWENKHDWGNGHGGSNGHDWNDDDHWDNDNHWDDDEIGDYCNGGPTQPVPEPETYAMMLAGLLMLGVAKRRQA
jgi:hypothetical protein